MIALLNYTHIWDDNFVIKSEVRRRKKNKQENVHWFSHHLLKINFFSFHYMLYSFYLLQPWVSITFKKDIFKNHMEESYYPLYR